MISSLEGDVGQHVLLGRAVDLGQLGCGRRGWLAIEADMLKVYPRELSPTGREPVCDQRAILERRRCCRRGRLLEEHALAVRRLFGDALGLPPRDHPVELPRDDQAAARELGDTAEVQLGRALACVLLGRKRRCAEERLSRQRRHGVPCTPKKLVADARDRIQAGLERGGARGVVPAQTLPATPNAPGRARGAAPERVERRGDRGFVVGADVESGKPVSPCPGPSSESVAMPGPGTRPQPKNSSLVESSPGISSTSGRAPSAVAGRRRLPTTPPPSNGLDPLGGRDKQRVRLVRRAAAASVASWFRSRSTPRRTSRSGS